jgi:ATP:corrinoid adenosyltransferase
MNIGNNGNLDWHLFRFQKIVAVFETRIRTNQIVFTGAEMEDEH